MNWQRKAEISGEARSRAGGSAKRKAYGKTRRRRPPALKQLAAGVRWTVSSWVTPAGSDARWEQSQDCNNAPGDSQ